MNFQHSGRLLDVFLHEMTIMTDRYQSIPYHKSAWSIFAQHATMVLLFLPPNSKDKLGSRVLIYNVTDIFLTNLNPQGVCLK